MDCVEMFECVLCDSRLKGKKQHLTRIHKIEQDVYDIYVTKRQLGWGSRFPTWRLARFVTDSASSFISM